MGRFAHISDVHLGGWKQGLLQDLNLQAFRKAVETCIREKLDFILFSGDLFDSAYPPIETLKETFNEFKKLKEAKIPCFIIAGSHDYSVSGKTFLDVLEKAGFCRNVANFEEKEDRIILSPVVFGNFAIYGYPGKKSGLEIEDLKKIKLNDAPGLFKILMLHTAIDKAIGSLPINSIDTDLLPKADYYALGHLHIDFQYQNFIYPGPIFPNNFQELEDLQAGSFYLIDTGTGLFKKIELKLKEIVSVDMEIKDALNATERIIFELDKKDLKDKIILLRLRGELEKGKNSDIKFPDIEEFVKKKGAYFLLKNTHDLSAKESVELEVEVEKMDNIENETISLYSDKNPSDFNSLIPQLINSISIEKQEGEKSEIFTARLLEEARKILKF